MSDEIKEAYKSIREEGKPEEKPIYFTKDRVKHLYALILASQECIGYYGDEKARSECQSRVYERVYPEVSANIEKFASVNPEGFKRWLRGLEIGRGIR